MVSDVAGAARASREEALRYRGSGELAEARGAIAASTHILEGHIDSLGTTVSPDEYGPLIHELIDTVLVQADLAATDGDYRGVREALAEVKKVNRRLAPDERVDITANARAAYADLIQSENCSYRDRRRGRSALEKLPDNPESIERRLKRLEANIERAVEQQHYLEGDHYQIAEEWLKCGDPESVEWARRLAVHRMTPTVEGRISSWSRTKEENQVSILRLCAYAGNKEAASDCLYVVKKVTDEGSKPWHFGFRVGDALLAGLDTEDDEVVAEVLDLTDGILSDEPGFDRYPLQQIADLAPGLRVGKNIPEVRELLNAQIMERIFDQRSRLKPPE